MLNIEISIIDDWPRLKLVIRGPGGKVRTETAMYDVAQTKFEPHLTNALREATQDLINRRKR